MRRIWDADESFCYPSWIYCYCTKDDPLYTALKKGDSCNGFRGPWTGVTGCKGCSCSLGQGLAHLAQSLVHLPNLIKEIIERVFTLGNWCFGLLCTTCQHTIWTWIACNHWQHRKPFIDVNPNPNHKPACPCHSSKSCMGVIHGTHFPRIQTMKTRCKDHLNVNCSGFLQKTHTGFATEKLLREEKFAHIWAELKGWITILQPEQRNMKKDEGSVGSVSVYLTDRQTDRHKK